MKLLAEISEGSLGLSDEFSLLGSSYELRKSARAILLNDAGAMATQYLQHYNYHKLPGGGVDAGESIEEALKREVKEEVGCDCAVVRPVGMTIEYRNKYKLLHISYCYVAKVIGEVGEPTLEEGEIEEGQETLWLPPTEVLMRMKTDTPGKFEGHFILRNCLKSQYLFNKILINAICTIALLDSRRPSQFLHNLRHFSSQLNVRSTTQRFGSTLNVCNSLRFTTSTSACNISYILSAKASPR